VPEPDESEDHVVTRTDLSDHGIDLDRVTDYSDDLGNCGSQIALPALGMIIAFYDSGDGWTWATRTTEGKPVGQDWAPDKPHLLSVLARHAGLDRRRAVLKSEQVPEL
jgi:hypothetical protein